MHIEILLKKMYIKILPSSANKDLRLKFLFQALIFITWVTSMCATFKKYICQVAWFLAWESSELFYYYKTPEIILKVFVQF